jgi:hypothetical protein
MKLIEPKQKLVKKGSFQKFIDPFRNLLPLGKTKAHAEDVIIRRFLKGLDNRFIMLCNLQLDGTGSPFPPILVGPTGIAVLNISSEDGFFKAKDDSWWKMDKATQRFNPGRPNLIKQSQDYAEKLASILDARGKSHPAIMPVLIFAHPGVHIETVNPALRIVLMDGVDSLIATFLNSDGVLGANEISFLSDSIEVMANPDLAIPMGEGEDFFGKDLLAPEKKAPPKMPRINIPSEMNLPAIEEKLQFTRKQWIILIVLLIATIAVLLGAIIFALTSL